MNEEWLELTPPIPDTLTKAASGFFCDYKGYMSLADSLNNVATLADTSARLIMSLRPGNLSYAETHSEKPGPGTGILAVYRGLIAELVWCRGVDNFLAYLAQLLGLIFRARPESLRSARQERLEDVLRFATMEEFIDHLADKRVYELTFQ